MSLSFPNRSRSFDENGNRVRFTGYDGVFEVRFFVEAAALTKLSVKSLATENEYLRAFDDLRETILAIAGKVYDRGRMQTICTLTAADFH